jgi:Zn-dependent peptidase ImmA (M78 family)
MSGLSLDEAAQKVPVKQERLEAWETGSSHPTIPQLRKLSDIYRRPLGLFLFAKVPADETLPGDYRRFTPDDQATVSAELRMAIRAARARRKALLELFDEFKESPPKFKLKASLGDSFEEVGSRIRSVLAPHFGAMDGRNVFNAWRTAAEAAGLLVFQADGIDLSEMRGFSLSDQPFPVAVLNIKDAYFGRTFTLLHEFAHVLLGNGGMCLLEEFGPNTNIKKIEIFCNHVAGAALVPAQLLLHDPETPKREAKDVPDEVLESLARRFGVSQEVIARRLLTLKRVTAEFYQRKRAEFAQQYEWLRSKQEPGFVPPGIMAVAKNGRKFTGRVLEAYDEERITASEVADLLGVRVKHLDRIREAVRSHLETNEVSE